MSRYSFHLSKMYLLSLDFLIAAFTLLLLALASTIAESKFLTQFLTKPGFSSIVNVDICTASLDLRVVLIFLLVLSRFVPCTPCTFHTLFTNDTP